MNDIRYAFENGHSKPSWFGVASDFTNAGDFATGHTFTGTAITSGTLATAAAVGGVARLSGAATTDDSGYQIQSASCFKTEGDPDGLLIEYRAIFKISESTSTDVQIQSQFTLGLLEADTSIEASVPNFGVFFRKDDGDTNLDCIVRIGGAEAFASLAVATIAKDTVYDFFIRIRMGTTDAVGVVEFYVDDVLKAQANVSTFPTTVACATASFLTGDALGTKWMDLDLIAARQERNF